MRLTERGLVHLSNPAWHAEVTERVEVVKTLQVGEDCGSWVEHEQGQQKI